MTKILKIKDFVNESLRGRMSASSKQRRQHTAQQKLFANNYAEAVMEMCTFLTDRQYFTEKETYILTKSITIGLYTGEGTNETINYMDYSLRDIINSGRKTLLSEMEKMVEKIYDFETKELRNGAAIAFFFNDPSNGICKEVMYNLQEELEQNKCAVMETKLSNVTVVRRSAGRTKSDNNIALFILDTEGFIKMMTETDAIIDENE